MAPIVQRGGHPQRRSLGPRGRGEVAMQTSAELVADQRSQEDRQSSTAGLWEELGSL